MLSIGAFSKISQETTNTLRYYDEIGLLKPARVNTDNGYRFYHVQQLEIILLIKKLKFYQFSLEEIAQVLKNPTDDALLLTLIEQKQRYIQAKIAHYDNVISKLESDISNLKQGKRIMSYLDDIQVKLVTTEPQHILYLREKISTADCGKQMGKLYAIIQRQQLTPLAPPMTIYHDEEFNPDCFDAEVAVAIQEITDGTRTLPGYLCAMSTHKGPYSELAAVYARLREWIETAGYTIAAAPFEVYLTNPAETTPDNCVTEVYFPVTQ